MKAIPVELPVGMPEPNPQLFTIKEVEGFLQEQKRLCRDIAYNVWDKWQTMECVMNAPPPQEFIDKIIVKST